MAEDFAGLHVVVTGGAGALGRAVVDAVLLRGAICHVPTEEEAGRSSLAAATHERLVVAPSVDLTDETAVTDFYSSLPSLWASIHCAGGFTMAPVAETPLAAWQHMLAMNATSCFLAAREAVRAMRRSREAGAPEGRGRIVAVAAQTVLDPRRGAGMVAYAASKAAVAALVTALAEEVASEGILVNAIAPSILDTPANRCAMPDADHARWPAVADVAATIAHLVSPANRTTRGGIVPVFGRS